MSEKRFELTMNGNEVAQYEIIDRSHEILTVYNNLGNVYFSSAMKICELLNNLADENEHLKQEKQLLKNKLDRIEDILPHYLSCAEICEFHSKTHKEDIALMKCWNKKYEKYKGDLE